MSKFTVVFCSEASFGQTGAGEHFVAHEKIVGRYATIDKAIEEAWDYLPHGNRLTQIICPDDILGKKRDALIESGGVAIGILMGEATMAIGIGSSCHCEIKKGDYMPRGKKVLMDAENSAYQRVLLKGGK
jgi:hypothetical protein